MHVRKRKSECVPSLVPRFRCALQDHTSAPVIAKYDQLTRGTQQLVQAAAVIGQEVRLSVQRGGGGGEDTRDRLTPGKCSEVSLSTNEMGARLIVFHEAFGLCFPVRHSVQGSRPILGMRSVHATTVVQGFRSRYNIPDLHASRCRTQARSEFRATLLAHQHILGERYA